jgi:hypothetical protein
LLLSGLKKHSFGSRKQGGSMSNEKTHHDFIETDIVIRWPEGHRLV